jgi:hypothetical protein
MMYATIALYFIALLMIPAAICLVVAAARNRLGDPLWWYWAAGGVAAILVFPKLYWVHFYYHLPIVPALCAIAAAAAPGIPRGDARRVLMTVAGVLASVAVVGELTIGNAVSYDAGRAAAAVVPPGQPIALFDAGAGDQVLFFADRNGISGGPTSNAVGLDQFSPFNACYAILFTTTLPRLPSDWSVVRQDPRFVVAERSSASC